MIHTPFAAQLKRLWPWGRTQLVLLASMLFFLVAGVLGHWGRMRADEEKMAARLEQRLLEESRRLQSLMHDSVFIRKITSEDGFNDEESQKWRSEVFGFFLYKYDFQTEDHPKLHKWTNNHLEPSLRLEYTSADTVLYIQSQELDYLHFIHSFLSGGEKYTLIGSLPIRIKYFVENQYLKESFPLAPSLDGHVSWKSIVDRAGAVVHGPFGKPLFRVHSFVKPLNNRYRPYNRALLALGAICFLVGAARLSRWAARRRGQAAGLAALICLLASLRIALPFLADGAGSASCDPWLYRGPLDLLFNSVLLFGLAVYVFRHIQIRPEGVRGSGARLVAVGAGLQICMGLLLYGLSWFYRYMFTMDSPPRLLYAFVSDGGGLPSVLALVIAQFSVFLLVYKLSMVERALTKNGRAPWVVLFLTGLVVGILSLLTQDAFSALLLSVFTIGLLWGMARFVADNHVSAIWAVAWLLYFSAFSAAQLYIQGNWAEFRFQKGFAVQLATERDTSFEKQFSEIEKRLLQDSMVKEQFSPFSLVWKPFVNIKKVDNYSLQRFLELKYLDKNFFSDYVYNVYCYDTVQRQLSGNPLRYGQLDTMFKMGRDVPGADNLRFWSNPDSSFRYIVEFCYSNSQRDIGTIFLLFTPKPLLISNVYERLLSHKNRLAQEQLSDLEFAVYKGGSKRREEGGRFPKKPDPGWTIPDEPGGYSFFSEKNKNYLVWKGPDNIVAVVRTDTPPHTRAFSLFSFLFCFHLGAVALLLLSNRWLGYLPYPFLLPSGKGFSLRGRIQAAMVAVILLAFVTIATVTMLYNQQQLSKYHRSRNERNVATIARSLGEWYNKRGCSKLEHHELAQAVQSIGHSERLVVNLYDLEGQLQGASIKEYEQRNMVADPMDPVAFRSLTQKRESMYLQTEQIGSYSYTSAYVPLEDADGHAIAYANVPYDSDGDRSVRHDNVELLGTLLNVYVLLLLIAGAVALAVANSATRPLTAVAEKLQLVQLGRRNEPLEWKTDDEIGTLIRRYNEMIQQLEESSAELARTQKETAWREMAKQVAHEIKNPLTPMKIHLQLLERAFRDDPERGLEMYRRVSSSLIEQIDNLARIASEFSDFAKMPQAQNERLHLNALVGSVCELFRDMPDSDLTVEVPDAPLFVWADRNQLMRVLNNLLKNAEQAISKERRGQIRVRLEEKDGHAHISVRDNGTGIPEEMIEKVFLPNFTTKSSGMGLGLAMSKNIVESANGRIRFETAADEGTVFLIEIPLMAEDQD